MAEKQYDPWPMMAVEKQFHEMNGNQNLPMSVPATLTWLQTEGLNRALPKARWVVDEMIQELSMALERDQYAQSLTEILWGGRRGQRLDRPASDDSGGGPNKLTVERDGGESRVDIGEEDKYATYAPTIGRHKDTQKHPAKLVESAAMGTVKYPDTVTNQPSLPAETVTESKNSDAQLVNVVLAAESQSKMLPNGEYRGFFDGDGSRAGKGRYIAVAIADNFVQRWKKVVWFFGKEKPD